MQRQQPGPPARKNFDRFIYYFSGVAIGCVLLGVLTQAKTCSAPRSDGRVAPLVPSPSSIPAPQTKP